MTVNSNLYLLRTVINLFPLRIIRFMVRHVKYFLGLRFEVSGWEHLQTEGPYVIISNHQSSLDVLGTVLPLCMKINVFDIDFTLKTTDVVLTFDLIVLMLLCSYTGGTMYEKGNDSYIAHPVCM